MRRKLVMYFWQLCSEQKYICITDDLATKAVCKEIKETLTTRGKNRNADGQFDLKTIFAVTSSHPTDKKVRENSHRLGSIDSKKITPSTFTDDLNNPFNHNNCWGS